MIALNNYDVGARPILEKAITSLSSPASRLDIGG